MCRQDVMDQLTDELADAELLASQGRYLGLGAHVIHVGPRQLLASVEPCPEPGCEEELLMPSVVGVPRLEVETVRQDAMDQLTDELVDAELLATQCRHLGVDVIVVQGVFRGPRDLRVLDKRGRKPGGEGEAPVMPLVVGAPWLGVEAVSRLPRRPSAVGAIALRRHDDIALREMAVLATA